MSDNQNLAIGAGLGVVAGAGAGYAVGGKKAKEVIENLDKTDLKEALKEKIKNYKEGLNSAVDAASVVKQTDEFVASDAFKEATKGMDENATKSFTEQVKGLLNPKEGENIGDKLSALAADTKEKIKNVFGLKAEEGKTVEDKDIAAKITEKTKEMTEKATNAAKDFADKFAKNTKLKWAAGIAAVGAVVGGVVAYFVNKAKAQKADKQ